MLVLDAPDQLEVVLRRSALLGRRGWNESGPAPSTKSLGRSGPLELPDRAGEGNESIRAFRFSETRRCPRPVASYMDVFDGDAFLFVTPAALGGATGAPRPTPRAFAGGADWYRTLSTSKQIVKTLEKL